MGMEPHAMIRPTTVVTVYLAGDVADARRTLREICNPPNEGLCVTLTPCDFIYTHGMESGVAVGFVDYPRFPKSREEILARARLVATRLVERLGQKSALIVGPDTTEWLHEEGS